MNKQSNRILVAFAAALFVAAVGSLSTAIAGLHGPRPYTAAGGSVSGIRQQAIVFHAGGREELIIDVEASLSETDEMPGLLAWVIALPSVPDAYHTGVDSDVFFKAQLTFDRKVRRDLYRLNRHNSPHRGHGYGPPSTKPVLRMPGRNRSSRGSLTQGTPLTGKGERPAPIAPQTVGPYEIQPINVQGGDDVAALNAWLTTNGFDAVDPDQTACYAGEALTYLCIKVRPSDEAQPFGVNVELSPLRISFATDKPFYPLIVSSQQENVDLDVVMFTEQRIDFQASADACRRLGISDDNDKHYRTENRFTCSYPASWNDRPHWNHWRHGTENGKDSRPPPWWANRRRGRSCLPRTNLWRVEHRRNRWFDLSEVENELLQSLIGELRAEHWLGGGTHWYFNHVTARGSIDASSPNDALPNDIIFELQPPIEEPVEADKPTAAT